MSSNSASNRIYGEKIPDAAEFSAARAVWQRNMERSTPLRSMADDFLVEANKVHYTHLREWMGVPIVRLPEDIVVLQELVWQYRPTAIVETGVARGGGLILSASLQKNSGLKPSVLGIDLKIFDHTVHALASHPLAEGIEVLEANSVSQESVERVAGFLEGHERALLILDSDHSHDHVLSELESLARLFPTGSFVLVADTFIEFLPTDYVKNRPWARGNSPMTAVREFLQNEPRFALNDIWSRKAMLSEFTDGVLEKKF